MKGGEWHRIFNLLSSNGSFYLRVQSIGNRIGLVRKEGLKTSLLLLHQFPFRHITTHFKRGSKFHLKLLKWTSVPLTMILLKSLETAFNLTDVVQLNQNNYASFEALVFTFKNLNLNFPLLSLGNLASSLFEKERRFQNFYEVELSKFIIVNLI